MQTRHVLITRTETILCQFVQVVHLLSKPVRGNQSWCFHVKDNFVPKEKDIPKNIKRFGMSWKIRQIEQFRVNKMLYLNSLKQNII